MKPTRTLVTAARSDGVKFLFEENGCVIYEIAAGEYKFESKN